MRSRPSTERRNRIVKSFSLYQLKRFMDTNYPSAVIGHQLGQVRISSDSDGLDPLSFGSVSVDAIVNIYHFLIQWYGRTAYFAVKLLNAHATATNTTSLGILSLLSTPPGLCTLPFIVRSSARRPATFALPRTYLGPNMIALRYAQPNQTAYSPCQSRNA